MGSPDDDTTTHGFAGVNTAEDMHYHGVLIGARTIKLMEIRRA